MHVKKCKVDAYAKRHKISQCKDKKILETANERNGSRKLRVQWLEI